MHNSCNEWNDFLHANKGKYSGEDWLQLATSEDYSRMQLQKLENAASANLTAVNPNWHAHGFSRHGADTGITKPRIRAFTGILPDTGVKGAIVDSTLFVSNSTQLKAVREAMAKASKKNCPIQWINQHLGVGYRNQWSDHADGASWWPWASGEQLFGEGDFSKWPMVHELLTQLTIHEAMQRPCNGLLKTV